MEWWYGDYDAYYSACELTLIDMAHCFGIDEYDVILLIDYGCTVDEVEDLMMDADALKEAVSEIKIMDGEYLYKECLDGCH